jgi:hypothetical protein
MPISGMTEAMLVAVSQASGPCPRAQPDDRAEYPD